jgi:hypothetical protein
MEDAAVAEPRLWRVIDLVGPDRDLRGYLSIGDLNGDGRPELLVHRHYEGVVPAYFAAMDLDGVVLWEWGDRAAEVNTHLLRGAVSIYDIDGDGAMEVNAECSIGGVPHLCRFDGATGTLEHSQPSPLLPEWRVEIYNMRGVPLLFVANLSGGPEPREFILKYDASQTVPGRVWGLDTNYSVRWYHEGNVSHLPKVADVDGDGRDEFASGDALLDDDGSVLWEYRFEGDTHVDEIGVGELDGDPDNGLEVVASSGCHVVRLDGSFAWKLGLNRVPEGQRLLVGDFIASSPGLEIFLVYAGHQRNYFVLSADGQILTQIDNGDNYMDAPMPVAWSGNGLQQIWLPGMAQIIDGHNRVVGDLSDDPDVAALSADSYMFTQAFAANVIGDEREELIVYFPYGGTQVRIYSPDPLDETLVTPYLHREDLYNWITNF